MKRLSSLFICIILAVATVAQASSSEPVMAPDDAMTLLKEGNARYAAGQSTHPRQAQDRRTETSKGQHPFATIIGCSDSREPVEILFDQGLGDLFVIRVAGNVAGPDEIATVEYGVGHLGTPIVLVLGHTSCGAVTAVVQNAKTHGHLPFLLNQIKPAVAKAKVWNPTTRGDEFVLKAIKANVWLTMENLIRKSHEVSERVKKGQLLLVGGIYDITTGAITWLGQHPEQGKLLMPPPKPKPKPVPKAKAEEPEPTADVPMVDMDKPMVDTGVEKPKADAKHEAPKKAPAHQ